MIEEGAQYTLDFIDSHSGGWGWAGLDDVIIRPGTAPDTGGFLVSVGLEGGQIVVEYTGQLERASGVEGPWLPVEGASSPFSEPASLEMQFFRAVP